jgi:hypothetical protein
MLKEHNWYGVGHVIKNTPPHADNKHRLLLCRCGTCSSTSPYVTAERLTFTSPKYFSWYLHDTLDTLKLHFTLSIFMLISTKINEFTSRITINPAFVKTNNANTYVSTHWVQKLLKIHVEHVFPFRISCFHAIGVLKKLVLHPLKMWPKAILCSKSWCCVIN